MICVEEKGDGRRAHQKKVRVIGKIAKMLSDLSRTSEFIAAQS